jgi:hypothetical protein
MPPLSFVLLHAGAVAGFAAVAVLGGLALFVFVLAYMLSSLQRDDARKATHRGRARR